MKAAMLIAALVLSGGTVSAHAANFDCVPPVFPEQSTSAEGVRRVEKQIRAWRTCYTGYTAKHNSADAAKLNADVDAGVEKWMASTRAYSNHNAAADKSLVRARRSGADGVADRRNDLPPHLH